MINISREQAIAAMVSFYPQARRELTLSSTLFGKALDRHSRRLALKLSGVELPEGMTIAWATPPGWGKDGYRAAKALLDCGGDGSRNVDCCP